MLIVKGPPESENCVGLTKPLKLLPNAEARVNSTDTFAPAKAPAFAPGLAINVVNEFPV